MQQFLQIDKQVCTIQFKKKNQLFTVLSINAPREIALQKYIKKRHTNSISEDLKPLYMTIKKE